MTVESIIALAGGPSAIAAAVFFFVKAFTRLDNMENAMEKHLNNPDLHLEKHTLKSIDGRFEDMKTEFDKVERRFDRIELKLDDLRDRTP